MPDYRFPKLRRMLKPADFDRVFQRRRSQADGMLLVYACENGLGVARLGMVVSRKCGDATVRNRWKRCIRDAFRLAQHDLPAGVDLVVLPRTGATPAMPRIQQSLRELAVRAARQLTPARPAPAREPGPL
jgi:ribonuclease P protein component